MSQLKGFNLANNKLEHKKILRSLDPSVTRVKVETEFGKKEWREIAKLQDRDVIQKKKDGTPYTMTGTPGRKAKAAPPVPVNQQVAAQVTHKSQVIEEDALVQSARENPYSEDTFHRLFEGMSVELASLQFERQEAERQGLPTTQFSAKRITGLKSMAEVLLRKSEQMTKKTIDLDSPAFRELFKFIMDTFKSAMKSSGHRQEEIERVFNKLGEILEDGWADEAKTKMGKL